MTKNCTSNHPCYYRTLGGAFYGCNYDGYCDFQLPRDSRMQSYMPNFPSLGAEQICEYCHLPLSKCKGHVTC